MQFSTLFLASLPFLALAAPATLPKRQFPAQPNPNEDITAAAAAWLQDTGFVSSFLDFATSTFPAAPPNLLANAASAVGAELDELNHKKILDAFFVTNAAVPNPDIVAANDVLVNQFKFQMVVDGLMNITATGNLDIVAIINANRCANVLPAIDAYFNAVAVATGQPTFFPAIRPAACGGAFHG